MNRASRVLAATVLALGAVAGGSAVADAAPAAPALVGTCSPVVTVPGTMTTFAHCDRAGTAGTWTEWVAITNRGNAETLQSQVVVKVNGSPQPLTSAILAVPARTQGDWDPVTGRRILSAQPTAHRCIRGTRVEPSVRLRRGTAGVWSPWVPGRPFVCA